MTTATIDLQSEVAAARAERPHATNLELLTVIQAEWTHLNSREFGALTHDVLNLLGDLHHCADYADFLSGEFVCGYCGQRLS